MTELPPLGQPRLPGGEPQPGVLDAVLRRGRARLRRSVLTSTGAVLAMTAGVLGATVLDGTDDGALVVIPASPSPGPGASPGATGLPLPSATSQAPQPSTSTGAGGGLGVAPTAPGQSSRPASGGGATPRPKPRPVRPYRENPSRTANATSCDVNDVITGTPPGTRVCAMATAAASVRSGEQVTAELSLCNSISSDRAYVVEFPSGREHDLQVLQGQFVEWTWSRAYTFPEGPHTRDLPPGYCLEWLTTWDTRDDAGHLVAPGPYYLEPTIELTGDQRRFSIRVEVTPPPTASPSPSSEPPL